VVSVPKHPSPRIANDTPIGPDVDLVREDLRLADGTRLTQEVADEIVDKVHRSAGRPSLSGRAAASPQIAFRVAPSVRDRAAELAAREGKTISQLAREALEERVAASQ
jgi:predicted HicB family RNase H-like nuclease